MITDRSTTTYRVFIETRTFDFNSCRAPSRLATEQDAAEDVMEVTLPNTVSLDFWLKNVRELDALWFGSEELAFLNADLQMKIWKRCNRQFHFFIGRLLATGLRSNFHKGIWDQIMTFLDTEFPEVPHPMTLAQASAIVGKDYAKVQHCNLLKCADYFRTHPARGLKVA